MPVTGRKPKDNPRNHVPPVHDWTEVRDVPFAGGPKLPRLRPDGKPWPKRTKAWWLAVSTMPHCVLWRDSDWSFALDVAQLAAAFHEGDMARGPELRQREALLGTTLDARRDLRIRYLPVVARAEPPTEEQEAAPVAKLDDYRDVYGGGPAG